MAVEVVWTKQAEMSFQHIIDYIEENWTEREVGNFVTRTFHKIELLRIFPKIGIQSASKQNVFRTILSSKTVLVYQYKPRKHEILILDFLSTAKNNQEHI